MYIAARVVSSEPRIYRVSRVICVFFDAQIFRISSECESTTGAFLFESNSVKIGTSKAAGQVSLLVTHFTRFEQSAPVPSDCDLRVVERGDVRGPDIETRGYLRRRSSSSRRKGLIDSRALGSTPKGSADTPSGDTQYTVRSRASIPMYTSGGRRGVAGRASFVECGLILMGTDDKQRKQASGLSGEICLLLAGVQQWGRYTRARARASHTDEPGRRRAPRHQRLPRRFAVAGCAARTTCRTGRATPERAARGKKRGRGWYTL